MEKLTPKGKGMKTSTKFFIAATIINIVLSIIAALTTFLRDVRVVDLVTFYATAFGAGASFAATIVSLQRSKKEKEASQL
ncbi:MAG: hypothetical protein WCX28_04630 [Bacteriovoracaceae bacterium]|nr:hypothetical protein [Bacteroidota bacterium]